MRQKIKIYFISHKRFYLFIYFFVNISEWRKNANCLLMSCNKPVSRFCRDVWLIVTADCLSGTRHTHTQMAYLLSSVSLSLALSDPWLPINHLHVCNGLVFSVLPFHHETSTYRVTCKVVDNQPLSYKGETATRAHTNNKHLPRNIDVCMLGEEEPEE